MDNDRQLVRIAAVGHNGDHDPTGQTPNTAEILTAAYMATGHAMRPYICSGDMLELKRCSRIVEYGHPHVIVTKNDAPLLRRVYDSGDTLLCRADNDEYPPVSIPKSEVAALYKVTALHRKLTQD